MAIMAVVVSNSDETDELDFESFALSSDTTESIVSALSELRGSLVDEAVVLSTCARTEIYVQAKEFHRTVEAIAEVISSKLGVSQSDFQRYARVHYADGAAEHLYRVACGLESRIVGESEILAQVKEAIEEAVQKGTSGPVLNRLFREAIEVGKWTRAETSLSVGSTSVGSAAVKILLSELEEVADPNVAVVGSGVIATEVVEILSDSGAVVTVVARDPSKAQLLAKSARGKFAAIEDLETVLAGADGAIFATTSPTYLLSTSNFVRVRSARVDPRPLVVVDLSLPRDVQPDVAKYDGIKLTDLEGVNQLIERSMSVRLDAVAEVEAKISAYLERFPSLSATKEISPVIASLYQRAETIRVEELAVFFERHRGLDPKLASEIDRLTNHIVKKLLHTPATQLRKVVDGSQNTDIVEDAKVLFGL